MRLMISTSAIILKLRQIWPQATQIIPKSFKIRVRSTNK